MKTNNRKIGYSSNTANNYIDNKQAIYFLSTEFEQQIRFENGHRRNHRLQILFFSKGTTAISSEI